MLNKSNLLHNINLHNGENILKSNVQTNLLDHFQNLNSQPEVDNFIINSNLNNNNMIK